MDHETWPGDLIATKIVAFKGDIGPQGSTSNVVVFNEAKDTLFWQFNLPQAHLAKTVATYSLQANGINQLNTFLVDPEVTARVTGVVTRMIPIPILWTSMFIDGPNFGTAFGRVFDLFNLIEEEEWRNGWPCIPSWR